MKTRTELEHAECWLSRVEDIKEELPDFDTAGGTTSAGMERRWTKLCTTEGKCCYKAYTLTPSQTARVESMLYGLEKMATLAVKLALEVERLKEEIVQGPQGTVDSLIAYLDPDSGSDNKRKR
jgi:hypothetical protein